MSKLVLWTIILVLAMQIFGSEIANASGLPLGPNRLVHGFDSITNHQQVSNYIARLNLQLNPDRQLIVVSGTHGICPTGAPDKAQGCREITFVKEDYRLFNVNDAKYVQVVDYHNLKNWADFVNKHTNDHMVLAWCYSACWKGTPFYKADYCPRDNSVNPSVRVTCNTPALNAGGYLPGTPQNPY